MILKQTPPVLLGVLILSLAACAPPKAERANGNPDTPAGKAGKAAYKVGQEAEKAAKEAEIKLNKAARDAQAGWKDAKKQSDN